MSTDADVSAAEILVIEDDRAIASSIVRGLRNAGFTVELASDGRRGVELALSRSFALIILDLMLPEVDGFEALALWRGRLTSPVIVLTALTELDTRLRVFSGGAVDYVSKPFWIDELVARVRARLRLPQMAPLRRSVWDDVVVDLDARTVSVHGAPVAMTSAELSILAFLIERPGRAVSRGQLAEGGAALRWRSLRSNDRLTRGAYSSQARRDRLRAHRHGVGNRLPLRPAGVAMNRSVLGLSGRVFLAAAICAALSAALAMVVLISVLAQYSLKRITYLTPQLDPFLRQQCERDPTYFNPTTDADLAIDFYDITTLKPALPNMAPADPQLLARLRAGEEVPTRFYYFQLMGKKRGGAALRRVAARGPCSLVQLRWNVGRAERNRTWLLLFAIPVASIAIAVALASFFAVRPLLLRLARLRRATQQIGQISGYASAADPEADDVGQLSLLLDQAHARIAVDAAEAAERQADLAQHLANVAHDLRTPLASLQLTIERLADSTELTISRLTDSTSTPDSELVRNAIDDVVYMGALIGNLYLACQLQDGADPLRGDPHVDLCALIEQVTRRFAKLGQARAIEVHGMRLDAPLWARCNPAMAEQVLQNLVHNAVAHGDEGGHVAVLLEATDDRFTLHVIDDGPGVPPAELPRLGERTFRSDAARQRDPAGGGLGLAIASEVCRRANFTLSFSREEPRGLRVTVTGERVRNSTSS